MRVFHCTCGQPLFFENLRCLKCGSECAYDPVGRELCALNVAQDGSVSLQQDTREPPAQFRFCSNRDEAAVCNWLVPAESVESLCLSCQLTRVIPDLSVDKNRQRLRKLESAKRRVLFALQDMHLPIVPKPADGAPGLAFELREPAPGEPVLTGHANGLITLNVAEADDDFRERNREGLDEPYRTVVGHLRHELGHYYWDVLVRDTFWLPRFRATFGDERADYCAALKAHYANGPAAGWQSHFVSSYATCHPWEDWAESWAHYLHMRSTLQTVSQFGLGIANVPLQIDSFAKDALYGNWASEAQSTFLGWINAWVVLTQVLNEVSRSMGQPDIYPFVMNRSSVTKLHFVHCVIYGEDADVMAPLPERLISQTLE